MLYLLFSDHPVFSWLDCPPETFLPSDDESDGSDEIREEDADSTEDYPTSDRREEIRRQLRLGVNVINLRTKSVFREKLARFIEKTANIDHWMKRASFASMSTYLFLDIREIWLRLFVTIIGPNTRIFNHTNRSKSIITV